jgi:hypothetical protein
MPEWGVLWPPTVFAARELLIVRNQWQANMFRKFKDMKGQSWSGAQMREGGCCPTRCCGVRWLYSRRSFGSILDETPEELPRAASLLMETTLWYLETMYESMREHADDHGYQLAYPKAVALGRIQRDRIRASNQYSPSVQSDARRIREATVTAETKARANNKSSAKSGGDDYGTGALTSS